MDIQSALIDRIHAKLVKHGATKRTKTIYEDVINSSSNIVETEIETPITDNFRLSVVVFHDRFEIGIGLVGIGEYTSEFLSSPEFTVYSENIRYEPARPTFDPESIISNIYEMHRSIRLSFNKFEKHLKKVRKSCGLIPIHGKR